MLLGAAAAIAAAACGSDGGDTGGASATTGVGDENAGTADGDSPVDDTAGASLLAYFAANDGMSVQANVPQRLTFGLGNSEGVVLGEVPATLQMQISNIEEPTAVPIGDPFTVEAHGDGLPKPYYPVTFEFPAPGVYGVAADFDGKPITATLMVGDADAVPFPQVGDAVPTPNTPTTADPLGVDPICTREPACDFHEHDLATVAGDGAPVALFIGTPAFCRTAICGPTLDLLIEAAGDYPTVRFIHAEVYIDDDPAPDKLTDTVQDFGLTFEPSLFLVDGTGTIVDRHGDEALGLVATFGDKLEKGGEDHD